MAKETAVLTTINLPESMYREVKDRAKTEYRSMASLVRVALAEYLNK